MKTIGCLASICGMLLVGVYASATPLETKVEQQVISQTQAQYSAKTQFFLALENLQINARINSRDEKGFINGVFDLAEKYENAVKGHSQLYAVELYSYMNQRLAVQTRWNNRTVAAYVIKSLRKEAKHGEFSIRKHYLKIANELSEIHKSERKYFPAVSEVAMARAKLVDVQMAREIAQAQVRCEDLTTPYLRDIEQGLRPLVRLGKALAQADPAVLQMIGDGLKRDPLKAVDTPVYVEKFLAKYGRYAHSQTDGSIAAELGYKMLEQE